MASTPPGPFERFAPESADHRLAQRGGYSVIGGGSTPVGSLMATDTMPDSTQRVSSSRSTGRPRPVADLARTLGLDPP